MASLCWGTGARQPCSWIPVGPCLALSCGLFLSTPSPALCGVEAFDGLVRPKSAFWVTQHSNNAQSLKSSPLPNSLAILSSFAFWCLPWGLSLTQNTAADGRAHRFCFFSHHPREMRGTSVQSAPPSRTTHSEAIALDGD